MSQTNKPYFFTSRKVMGGAIAIVTLLVGFISLTSLPIEQYPDIAPPTVRVETCYTGADANAVMNSVILPLEESINGVENMMYMTSEGSCTGDVSIQVYFKQGTDPDMATVNVQNRVSKVLGMLPSEVNQVGVQVYKSQNSILRIGMLESSDDRFDVTFLNNYLDIYVLPRVQRVSGVGKVLSLGSKYSMRIWMKPDRMAHYKLVPSDIFNAIGKQNLVYPAGKLGESSDNTYQYNLEYSGRLKTIEEFENIVLKANNDGTELKLGEVATVELGAEAYYFSSECDGHPGVPFIVFQTAGANANQVNQEIDNIFNEMQSQLPPGTRFRTIQCSNDFLFAAIDSVVETLIIAIILVVIVVYFFLQSFRATVIPTISIIVSLVGTFAIVKLAGFSLNILTLFALVLAIGTVVDDAIVVVEAVMAKFENGYKSPLKATNAAMHDVFLAVLSCTFVFMAVFIPVTFMPGTSGTFFTQFGITIAAAVGLSGLNALTLCPGLCAILLKPANEGPEKKDFNFYVKKAYNAAYGGIYNKYIKAIPKFLKRPFLAWIGVAVALVLMFWMMSTTPQDLVPQEDQGVVLVNVSTPPGYTMKQTEAVLTKVEQIASKYEEVEFTSRVSGYGMISGNDACAGTIFIRLKPWADREGLKHSINMVIYRLFMDTKSIPEAQVLPFQMPQIPGYGTGNAIELQMQNQGNGDMTEFAEQVKTFVGKLKQRPEISSVFNTYNNTYPKFRVKVNPTVCDRAGVSVGGVLEVLGAYCGGSYISNYNSFNKVYRVMCQASPESRLDPQSLQNMFIRVSNGEMAPLSQFVTLEPLVGSSVEKRFNLFPAILLNVTPASGYSASQAFGAIQEVFKETMPQTAGYEYGGMARETQESTGSSATTFIYIICILCIYLIMACLYNSWYIPFAVLLSIPFGLMGAFAFIQPLTGMGFTNNIYLQTGVIMLIGLLSKTAILITEFATEKHAHGMSIYDAAIGACKDRLRPILMTVATMIIGMIPLVIESGAGAMGNRSLALGVIGGMSVGTLALVFVVPVFYMFFQSLHNRFAGETLDETEETPEA